MGDRRCLAWVVVLWLMTAPVVAVADGLADPPCPHIAGHPTVQEDDAALAARFAPLLYFHPNEVFFPQPVEVIVDQARLRQSRRLWFDVNVLLQLDALDLFDLAGEDRYFLDIWYGDDGSSTYTNYTAHRAYYQALLSPQAGGPPVTVYAHVVRDELSDTITIQYWALYFYNDWFNKHEGDWEMMQVTLDGDGQPQWVALSQHHSGTRRPWTQVRVEEETHPAVYVALGSHANYFYGPETYPEGKDVGSVRVEIMDRTGATGRTIPEVVLLPDLAEVLANPMAWPEAAWLPYAGRWGQLAPQGDFGGPVGPAERGALWEQPYAWGAALPLDTDLWYANRLRVEVVGATPDEAMVRLAEGQEGLLLPVEDLGNVAILHSDPPAAGITATIQAAPGTRWDVVATWPDAAAGQVTRYRFAAVSFGASGQAALTLSAADAPQLVVRGAGADGSDLALDTAQTESYAATWDAPDLVWISGVLPAQVVGAGLLTALLAAVLPSLLYVGVLYWGDRYEKEPKRLLTAAFIWGAIPALVVAATAELFFRLPLGVLGRYTLEAVRLGLVAPLLEEAIKGVAVLVIYLRWRREFDGVLDGVIYGAMVGFGFAMTGNLIHYVGNFLLWGMEGLAGGVLVDGVLYAMNHAVYTAVLGAGLGLARLARQRWQRWLWPLLAFLLAVVSHMLHQTLLRSLLGLNVLTVAMTGLGVILVVVVVVWSLARERRCLQGELRGVIPDALYRTLTTPGARTRAQWRALWREGVRGWRRARKLHQLGAELAFKRMQARLRPDEPQMAREAEALLTGLSTELGE